jgi:hypothetical protein
MEAAIKEHLLAYMKNFEAFVTLSMFLSIKINYSPFD